MTDAPEQVPMGALYCGHCNTYHKSSEACQCEGAKKAKTDHFEKLIHEAVSAGPAQQPQIQWGTLPMTPLGLLGAMGTGNESFEQATKMRLNLIESHILRLEEAFRLTGFDVHTIDMGDLFQRRNRGNSLTINLG